MLRLVALIRSSFSNEGKSKICRSHLVNAVAASLGRGAPKPAEAGRDPTGVKQRKLRPARVDGSASRPYPYETPLLQTEQFNCRLIDRFGNFQTLIALEIRKSRSCLDVQRARDWTVVIACLL